jgi:hypothetical protein
MRINCGGHYTFGLIQQVIHKPGQNTHRCIVNTNLIGKYINSSSQNCYVAINGDTPISNQVFAHAARPKTNTRQHLLQTLTFGKAGLVR